MLKTGRLSNRAAEQLRRGVGELVRPYWARIRRELSREEAVVLDCRCAIVSPTIVTIERLARRLDCSHERVTTLERDAIRKASVALEKRGLPNG